MTPDKVEAALGVLRRYGDICVGEGWVPEKARVDEALATLTAALAEREKDAGRYRWLRDVADNRDGVPFIGLRNNYGVSAWTGEPAEELIDAAMKEAP